MDKIIVTASGVLLMIFIYWFFFEKKTSIAESTEEDGMIRVNVDGGYDPEIIKLKKGIRTNLILTRKDANPCLEEFIIPDLKIKKYLPMNNEIKIPITPKQNGSWDFHCGMNMYHGKIIVE